MWYKNTVNLLRSSSSISITHISITHLFSLLLFMIISYPVQLRSPFRMKVRTSSLLLTVRGLAKTVINYHHRSTTTFSYYPSRRPIPTRRISATRIPPTISATRISRRPYYNNDMTQDPSSSSSSSSIITPESLSRTLQERLEATHTAVKDMSGKDSTLFSFLFFYR